MFIPVTELDPITYIHTVNNLYNDFIMPQDVFLTWKVRFLHFTWNVVLFSSYHNWPKFLAWSLTIQHRHATFLSTYDVRHLVLRVGIR